MGASDLPRVQGYELSAVLGSGGMGTVYRARQLQFDREVALKVIHPHLATDLAFRERFRLEMRAAITLQHPNIVPVYAASEADAQLFIAMLLVPGRDLASYMNEHGAFQPSEAVAIVKQIAGALDEAHGKRLIHRDVKPHNILVDERSTHVYLTDFGLARSLDATGGFTATGTRMGTIDYMSPEQIEGTDVGPASDVYALGCLLYAVLTGGRPFSGESDVSVIREKMRGPSHPTLADLGLPAALDAVVRRSQDADPSRRQASAGELAAAAGASLAPGASVAASDRNALARTEPHPLRRPGPRLAATRVDEPGAPASSSPRRRTIVVAALIFLLVGGVGAALVVSQRGSDDDPGKRGGAQAAGGAGLSSSDSSPSDSGGSGQDEQPAGNDSRVGDSGMIGSWSGDAQISYESGEVATFEQTIKIDSLRVGEVAGASTAVQGASTCTGPITLTGIKGQKYTFSYAETNTEECIDSSTMTLRREGDLLNYKETTDTSVSSALLPRGFEGDQPPSEPAPTGSDGWPDYQSGYAVMLSANIQRAGAESVAAAESGGVLWSSDYPGLTPGYWVAFAGPFSTEAAARNALPAYQDTHPDAYVKYVDGSSVGE